MWANVDDKFTAMLTVPIAIEDGEVHAYPNLVRAFFIPRMAWPMRCSFSVSAIGWSAWLASPQTRLQRTFTMPLQASTGPSF